jgi:fumarate hydratase class I
MFSEANTKTNLPAQIDLYATGGSKYDFLFIAKGGGSANKTFLYQKTKAVLNEKSMLQFLEENIKTIGTSACPPYHLAIVIGGLSAEQTLKTVKMASTKYSFVVDGVIIIVVVVIIVVLTIIVVVVVDIVLGLV